MKLFYILLGVTFLLSCKEEGKEEGKEKVQKENISKTKQKAEGTKTFNPNEKGEVVIEESLYTEYYAGDGQKVKFQGNQDSDDKRHGKWLYYSVSGEELSMTIYVHGIKNGHTIVKYPNGMLHYTGEYRDNKIVGVWKTYSEKGEVTSEKDYGYPE
jgi:antitoxin component YwqK of YwqJK toxin-antitoxin module